MTTRDVKGTSNQVIKLSNKKVALLRVALLTGVGSIQQEAYVDATNTGVLLQAGVLHSELRVIPNKTDTRRQECNLLAA
jgi:hypothetical protein